MIAAKLQQRAVIIDNWQIVGNYLNGIIDDYSTPNDVILDSVTDRTEVVLFFLLDFIAVNYKKHILWHCKQF